MDSALLDRAVRVVMRRIHPEDRAALLDVLSSDSPWPGATALARQSWRTEVIHEYRKMQP